MAKHYICNIFIISFCVIFSSCGTYPCAEAPGLRVSPVAFTDAERDTIILRSFEKNSGFTHFIDSTIISPANAGFTVSNDTAVMVTSTGFVRLLSKYDYKIYIPAVNRMVKITNIYEPQQEGRKSSILTPEKILCSNSIQSFVQDGNKIIATDDQLYIHK